MPNGGAQPRPAPGVTISGGGSRAALFGVAGLEALARVQMPDGTSVIDKISHLSSVSGGSLAATYYALKKPDREVKVLNADGRLSARTGPATTPSRATSWGSTTSASSTGARRCRPAGTWSRPTAPPGWRSSTSTFTATMGPASARAIRPVDRRRRQGHAPVRDEHGRAVPRARQGGGYRRGGTGAKQPDQGPGSPPRALTWASRAIPPCIRSQLHGPDPLGMLFGDPPLKEGLCAYSKGANTSGSRTTT